MERKEFQQGVLDTFDAYLDKLISEREQARQVEEIRARLPDPTMIPLPDWPQRGWEALGKAGGLPRGGQAAYSSRSDGAGRPAPSVCLKIPTGVVRRCWQLNARQG